MLRLADFFMRLEARLSYALIGLVQAAGYAGGLDLRKSSSLPCGCLPAFISLDGCSSASPWRFTGAALISAQFYIPSLPRRGEKGVNIAKSPPKGELFAICPWAVAVIFFLYQKGINR